MKVKSIPAKSKVEAELKKQVSAVPTSVLPTGTVFADTRKTLIQHLKNGTLSTSQYTGLDAKEKLFVELVVMANYTSEQAVRLIDPTCAYPDVVANRLITNKRVSAVISDLNKRKNIKMKAEMTQVREQALSKLKNLMANSEDESIQLAAAKLILDKSIELMKESDRSDESVGNVVFSIQVAPPAAGATSDPIILDADLDATPVQQYHDKATDKVETMPKKDPYTLVYEGVNAYEDFIEEFDDSDAQITEEE